MKKIKTELNMTFAEVAQIERTYKRLKKVYNYSKPFEEYVVIFQLNKKKILDKYLDYKCDILRAQIARNKSIKY